jgi:hypothetical protein
VNAEPVKEAVVHKPAQNMTLNAEEGEALIARVHQSTLSAADAGVVEWVIRMYCWVACALQDAKLSVKRLRDVFFGPRRTPTMRPPSASLPVSSEACGQGEGGGEVAPVAAEAPGEGSPTPKGGHRAGTGRLGADAYGGAERTECRHEELAVGQRCPVCGQGTLYALPPGVEMRIDGQALRSARRYA